MEILLELSSSAFPFSTLNLIPRYGSSGETPASHGGSVGSDPGVHMGFVVDKAVVGQGFLRVL
jgi:hypothetical protein